MTSDLVAGDPFGVTADPAGYMAREASERALAALERAVGEGIGVTILCGPPGIGKTLLLRVLEKRLAARLRPVYLPYAALRFEELCAWVLGLLGEAPQPGASPHDALRALAGRSASAGRPLLLLIDDAHAMPKDAAERLGQFVRETGPGLCVIVAGPDEAHAEGAAAAEDAPPWFAAFGSGLLRVGFDQPMSAAETALFVRARLERAALDPSARARFDAAVIGRLHRRSGGIARVVQSLAGEVLRRGESALPRESLEDLLAEDERSAAALKARASAAQPAPPTPERDAAAATARALPPRETSAPAPPGAREVLPPRSAAPPAPSVSPPAFEALGDVRAPETPRVAPPLQRPAPARLDAPPRALRIFLGVLGLGAITLAVPLLRGLVTPPPPIVPAPPPPQRAIERVAPVEPVEPREPEPLGAAPEQPIESLPMAPAPEPVARAPAVAPPAPKPAPLPPRDVAPVPVHVNATPWATITVDGIDLGETPIAGVPLVPGPHRFTARMPDGRVVERTVEIDAQRRHVSFE